MGIKLRVDTSAGGPGVRVKVDATEVPVGTNALVYWNGQHYGLPQGSPILASDSAEMDGYKEVVIEGIQDGTPAETIALTHLSPGKSLPVHAHLFPHGQSRYGPTFAYGDSCHGFGTGQ